MPRIKTITIPSVYRSIPADFKLDLADFTAITGENNTGKTNFVEAIATRKATFVDDGGNIVEVTPVYISAESIVGDEELKIGKTAEAFKALSELLTTDPSFVLEETEESQAVSDVLESFSDSVNVKLRELASASSGSSLRLGIQKSLKLKTILHDILSFIPSDSISSKDHKKFEELGQGWQRLIIAAFLLTKRDTASDDNHVILLLIEEPEVYLHPRLKRRFYAMLRALSEKDGVQVLITTHDPYLAGVSQDDGDGKSTVYSFIKTGEMTAEPQKGVVLGVEDELLHILLVEKALKKHNLNDVPQLDILLKTQQSMVLKDYYWPNIATPVSLSLPVYIRHKIHHPNNPRNSFSEEELITSIGMLNGILV
jgi:predicted ATPase